MCYAFSQCLCYVQHLSSCQRKEVKKKDAKNEKNTWILVVFCQLHKVETYGGHLKRHCDSKVLRLTVSGPYRKMLPFSFSAVNVFFCYRARSPLIFLILFSIEGLFSVLSRLVSCWCPLNRQSFSHWIINTWLYR